MRACEPLRVVLPSQAVAPSESAETLRFLVDRLGLERVAKELGNAPPQAVLVWSRNRGVSASVRRATERLAAAHGLRPADQPRR